MRRKRIAWDKMVDKVLTDGKVSKELLRSELGIKDVTAFQCYFKKATNGKRIYTLIPGYYSIPMTDDEHSKVASKLTPYAKGFIGCHVSNLQQHCLFKRASLEAASILGYVDGMDYDGKVKLRGELESLKAVISDVIVALE